MHNREPEWKTKGIQDADVSIVDYAGEDAAEQEEVRAYKLAVLNNIAICCRKTQQLNLAVTAHTEALELEPVCMSTRPPGRTRRY